MVLADVLWEDLSFLSVRIRSTDVDLLLVDKDVVIIRIERDQTCPVLDLLLAIAAAAAAARDRRCCVFDLFWSLKRSGEERLGLEGVHLAPILFGLCVEQGRVFDDGRVVLFCGWLLECKRGALDACL